MIRAFSFLVVILLVPLASAFIPPANAHLIQINVPFIGEIPELDAALTEEATVLLYSGPSTLDNEVRFGYSEDAGILVITLFLPDSTPQKTDDLVVLGLDLGHDAQVNPGSDDYLFLVLRAGTTEVYQGNGNDWDHGSYDGLQNHIESQSDDWMVNFHIPIELEDNAVIGFMVGQVDEEIGIVDYPAGAIDSHPNTWGDLDLSKVSLITSSDEVVFGNSVSLLVSTYLGIEKGEAQLQASRDGVTWEEIGSIRTTEGKAVFEWRPPSSGIYFVRAVFSMDGVEDAAITVPKIVEVNRAPTKTIIEADNNPIFNDQEFHLLITLDPPLEDKTVIEIDSNDGSKWVRVAEVPLEGGKYSLPMSDLLQKTLFRASFAGNENYQPSVSEELEVNIQPGSSKLSVLEKSLRANEIRVNDIKEEREEMEDQIQELKEQALKSNAQIEELRNRITNGKDDESPLDNSTAQVATQLVESKSQQLEINQKTEELSNLQIEVNNRTNVLYLVFAITVILGVTVLILLLKTRGRTKLAS